MFWRINACFFALTAFLVMGLGLFIYSSADKFAYYLIRQQAQPVMAALVAVERRWRDGPDRQRSDGEITALAAAVGTTFLVGKQVPVRWREAAEGLHLLPSGFVYITRQDGIVYALYGSSNAIQNFLRDMAGVLTLGGMFGLAAAVIVGILLGRHLALPLMRLARAIDSSPAGHIALPPGILSRKDEIGSVARAIEEHGALVHEYCRRETAFTGDVSHELRTPLAILSGGTEILSTQVQDRRLQEVISRMERTINGMSATVRALLNLARKNCEKMRPLDMTRIVEEQLEALREAGGCGCKTRVIGKGKAMGHWELASTAVGNTLGNACRAARLVWVFLNDAELRIMNDGILEEGDNNGLGLSITSRCCEKMGWAFHLAGASGRVVATIRWDVSKEANRPFIPSQGQMSEAAQKRHQG